jgi:N-acyl-D-aspartate/D-glutamate deacylase
LHEGLAAGGLGFSSTRSQSHNDAEGRPVPSRHASEEELVELAAVCTEHPGTSLEFLPIHGQEFPQPVIELMTRMSVAAQRPLNWNVLTVNAGTIEQCQQRLGAGDYAREHGGKIVALLMPMYSESRLNFLGGFGLDVLPGWAPMIALPPEEKLRVLSDPGQRRRLSELAAEAPLISRNWAERRIVETFTAETKGYEGRFVGEIAAAEDKEPFDALLDIVCADGLRTTFDRPQVDSRDDWVVRARVLRDPRIVVGASDAGAHLDLFGTFNYPTYLLHHAVRAQELLTTEEVVHLLTQVPAQLYGLRHRGILSEGKAADIVVFDEDLVGTAPLATRHDLPGGAGRLFAPATGIAHVIVNGTPIVERGSFTDARPGSILRSGRDTATPSLSS